MNLRIGACWMLMAGLLCGQDGLRKELEASYGIWRGSMISSDLAAWTRTTAAHRRMQVKNRILSEKKAYPEAIFDVPAPPPSIEGLKFLTVIRNGPTANAYYLGNVDFGQSGEASLRHLLVLSFVGSAGRWGYDAANFINLAALPEVRDELDAGDFRYLQETPELLPAGQIPPVPIEVGAAPYIAKVYVFCPGREVRVQVNQVSAHHFVSDKAAELVMGGVQRGENTLQYTVQSLAEEIEAEPLVIRVYAFSQVAGVKPLKIYEYLVQAGDKPNGFGKAVFTVDQPIHDQLIGAE